MKKLKTPKIEPEVSIFEKIYFDTISNCAKQTGIPVATLRFAKKSGSSAFRAGRVHLSDLLHWLFAREESAEMNWGDKLKEYQAKREKGKLDRENELTVDKSEVVFALNKGMSLLFGAMDRRSNLELPPSLKGLSETEIQAQLLKSDEELKELVRSVFEKLSSKHDKNS